MIRPQSWTATILLILTMPVSTSTETSAICTPPTPLLVSVPGPGFLPLTVMGVAPSLRASLFPGHAACSGSLLTRIVPWNASRSAGCASSDGATLAKSWSSASSEPRRVEALIPPMVVLPPEPPEAGIAVVAYQHLYRVERHARTCRQRRSSAPCASRRRGLACPS